jgi:LCP family protein required for cell wall assembly
MGKINTAFSYRNGSDLVVQTVEKLTGMQVNHYVQIDFSGFQSLVNALGGVPICVSQPMHDTYSGLNLPHKGCYNLKGAQALAFVRARHVEGDVIPDFNRIARQQQFTRAVIDKALSVGAIFHYTDIIDAVSKGIVVDKNLSLYDLQDLTLQLSHLGQKGVDFRVVPAIPTEIDGVAYVEALEPDAAHLFTKIREGKPLGTLGKEEPNTPLSEAQVTVRVLDADSNGKAQKAADWLARSGFIVQPVEPASEGYRPNVLYWGRGAAQEEQVVAKYFDQSFPIDYAPHKAQHHVITVVVGPDFVGFNTA